jgi:signal transduction histidine kinase
VKFTETSSILSVRPVDEGIEVTVTDTGVGIPAAIDISII